MGEGDADGVVGLALRVRDLVNHSRPDGKPVWRHESWGTICAAMDVVEDADLVLKEYVARGQGAGIGYLELYGVLQALILQQDAVKELMEALEVPGYPDEDERLKTVRDVRNDATGHPSRRDYGPAVASQVARGSMVREGFRLLRHPRQGGAPRIDDIDTLELIRGQQVCLAQALVQLTETLEAREVEHRQAHRGQKLSDLLPPFLFYAVEKVNEAAGDLEQGSVVARAALAGVSEPIVRFREALGARGFDDDSLPFALLSIARIEEALVAITARLEPDPACADEPDGAIVLAGLACLLEKEFNELVDLAAELDATYESDAVP